jgi:hypothetical protein
MVLCWQEFIGVIDKVAMSSIDESSQLDPDRGAHHEYDCPCTHQTSVWTLSFRYVVYII